ncbi:MAG: ABC transporter ATP-binding protein [Butyrivibrio sp.]
MIKLEEIYKTYNPGKSNAFTALKGVSLEVKEGEMLGIIGKSGAGKSTLMHIIGCVDNFEKGTYLLNGKDISQINESKRAEIRNSELGIVLQDFALIEEYSALENVMVPVYFSPKKSNKKERALNALNKMGIGDLADKKVNKLSGGQKQRVAIARAIVNNPKLILADEPTGALDVNTSKEIMNEFKRLNEEGATIIIITHDPDVAKECGRVLEMSDGKIVE